MKKIHLIRDKYAIVDNADFEWLGQWKWTLNAQGYAVRFYGPRATQKMLRMHRVIMNTPDNLFTDHINHNKLDNRRSNLRICTGSQNNANQKLYKNSTSGVKGVYWYKPLSKWKAQICYKGRRIHIGYYEKLEEATKARHSRAVELFGEFAT